MIGSIPLSRWVAPHLFLDWDLDHPSAWVEHAPFLAWLIGEHRPGRFVELGTHWGFSYFAALQVAQFLDLDMTAMAIDTWEGEAHAGKYSEDVFEYVSRVNDDSFSGRSRLFRGTFEDAASVTPDRSVDLVHIDGLHTYEASTHDFQTWLPKLSERGVVLFHDIAERKDDFGVYRTWEEVSAIYPSFAFQHGHGLGVLLVGRDVSEPILSLADHAGDGEGEAVRRAFSALGRNVSMDLGLRGVSDALGRTLAGAESRAAVRSAFLGEAETLRPIILRQAELLEDRDLVHGQLAASTAELAAAKADLDAAKADLDALRGQLLSLERALIESRDALDAVVESRSWRMTRGLRAASGIVDSVRRG